MSEKAKGLKALLEASLAQAKAGESTSLLREERESLLTGLGAIPASDLLELRLRKVRAWVPGLSAESGKVAYTVVNPLVAPFVGAKTGESERAGVWAMVQVSIKAEIGTVRVPIFLREDGRPEAGSREEQLLKAAILASKAGYQVEASGLIARFLLVPVKARGEQEEGKSTFLGLQWEAKALEFSEEELEKQLKEEKAK